MVPGINKDTNFALKGRDVIEREPEIWVKPYGMDEGRNEEEEEEEGCC